MWAKRRARRGTPRALLRWASTSYFSLARSTPEGHSALQALHSTQRSSAAKRRSPVSSAGARTPAKGRGRGGGAPGVGAAARRVLLLARDHEGGAHPAVVLATGALAVALLGGAGDAALEGEVEVGDGLPVARFGAQAQGLAEGGGVDDLAGIEEALRGEGGV